MRAFAGMTAILRPGFAAPLILAGQPPIHAGRMKVGEMLRRLHEDGWLLVATRGSHRQYKHPSKQGRVTVAGKPGDDLAAGTLNSILKQAGLKR